MNEEKRLQWTEQREPSELARRWPSRDGRRQSQRRQRLMDNKAYQTMESLTRYMDRYYLDALIGVIPGWGDAIALLCVVPFVYFSSRVIKSLPLTLADILSPLLIS